MAELRRQIQEKRQKDKEALLKQMSEGKHVEYFRQKQDEEENVRKRLEEERIRGENESERALRLVDEAKRLAEAEARRKFEARMIFLNSLHNEAMQLENSHAINRPFIFSYQDLLNYSKVLKNKIHDKPVDSC